MFSFICTCVCIWLCTFESCTRCICISATCECGWLLEPLFVLTRPLSCANLSATLSELCCCVTVSHGLPLTLSQASEPTSSFEGCSGAGLVHWSGPGRTRTRSGSSPWRGTTTEATSRLGLRWKREDRKQGSEGKTDDRGGVKTKTL